MAIVIDDHLLFDVLAGRTTEALQDEARRGGLFTTGTWYYRLARAIGAGPGTGRLSRRLELLTAPEARRITAALDELPAEVGLLSLRVVVPVMQALRVRQTLNMLSAEALAAAVILEASLLVSVDSPLLRAGAADLAVGYRVS